MTNRFRMLAVAGAGAVLATVGATAAAAATTTAVTGGSTEITIARTTSEALRNAGVTLAPAGGATLQNRVLTLPTTGGKAAPPNYVTVDAGGFTVTKGANAVTVRHLVVHTKAHIITADVGGNGTMVVFDLGDPNRGNGGPGMVQFGGYAVRFASQAAKTLDHALHTAVFLNHPRVGSGASTVLFQS